MNISSIIGLVLGFGVMYGALTGTTDNLKFFMDPHGILIVCGGTLAAASICFPIKDVLSLAKIFFLRVIGQKKVDFEDAMNQILELHKKTSLGTTGLSEFVPGLRHPFLQEAISLLSSGVLTESELRATLDQRLKSTEIQYMHEANMFRTIGRFPPAFGLLATTLGMIGLLQKIGQPDSQKLIGPAMSVGLIGTLYGIALANLVFIPIAENLTDRTQEELVLRRMIVEGTLLLKAEANPITIREHLNSFLSPRKRIAKKRS